MPMNMSTNTQGHKSSIPRHTISLLAILIFAFSSCLNPHNFSPEPGTSGDVNVSGELDIYNANNAVLWVANMTKTVNVERIRISVSGSPSPEGYPRTWEDTLKAGTSHVSYHKPAKSHGAATPYRYEIELKVTDPSVPSGVLKIEKTMPTPREYAIFLVRTVDDKLMLIDGDRKEMPETMSKDTSDPPVPPSGLTYPLIVRNRSKSALIDDVVFNDNLHHPVVVASGDQYPYHLHAGRYSTYSSYTLNDPAKTGSKKTPTQNVVVINTEESGSRSGNLLYLDFYKTRNGGYAITQNWPPNDLDAEDEYHGDFNVTKVRVLNKASSTTIVVTKVGIELGGGVDTVIVCNYTGGYVSTFDYNYKFEYLIKSDEFVPPGVISKCISWDRDSKTATFDDNVWKGIAGIHEDPNVIDRVSGTLGYNVLVNVDDECGYVNIDEAGQVGRNFKIDGNRPYTINIYIEGYGSTHDRGKIPFPGKNLYPGKTLDIEISDRDLARIQKG